MKTYDGIIETARSWTPDLRERALRELVAHRAFPALAFMLREQWEGWARSASHQKVSAHRDVLLNIAGSMQGVERVEEALQTLVRKIEKEL